MLKIVVHLGDLGFGILGIDRRFHHVLEILRDAKIKMAFSGAADELKRHPPFLFPLPVFIECE